MDSRSEYSRTFSTFDPHAVDILVTSGGDPQSLILRVLDFSVVGVAYVCAPNRCSIVYDVVVVRLRLWFVSV